MSEEDLYSRFANECIAIAEEKRTNWKHHPNVKYMLEHESHACAAQYVLQIKKTGLLSDEQIQRVASLNDAVGGAKKEDFGNGLACSPSSLRYIMHAVDLVLLLKKKGINVFQCIEIGGGYGGLALVTHCVAELLGIEIQQYLIYDLKEVTKLQQFYLQQHEKTLFNRRIFWGNAETCGADANNLLLPNVHVALVSHYCFSEIPEFLRQKYAQNLFPLAETVYMRWNWGSKDCIPKDWTIEPEVPDTSRGNGNTVVKK
jgi:hypothetical protein